MLYKVGKVEPCVYYEGVHYQTLIVDEDDKDSFNAEVLAGWYLYPWDALAAKNAEAEKEAAAAAKPKK
jgi:hypothetical protein